MPKSRKSRASNIKKETEALNYAQVIIQCNMLGIVTELEAIKANNNGKLPYGAITNMLKAQKEYLPWLTKKKSTTGYERQVLVLSPTWVYYQEILRQICAHFTIQVLVEHLL
jgi:hypothetical protein